MHNNKFLNLKFFKANYQVKSKRYLCGMLIIIPKNKVPGCDSLELPKLNPTNQILTYTYLNRTQHCPYGHWIQ